MPKFYKMKLEKSIQAYWAKFCEIPCPSQKSEIVCIAPERKNRLPPVMTLSNIYSHRGCQRNARRRNPTLPNNKQRGRHNRSVGQFSHVPQRLTKAGSLTNFENSTFDIQTLFIGFHVPRWASSTCTKPFIGRSCQWSKLHPQPVQQPKDVRFLWAWMLILRGRSSTVCGTRHVHLQWAPDNLWFNGVWSWTPSRANRRWRATSFLWEIQFWKKTMSFRGSDSWQVWLSSEMKILYRFWTDPNVKRVSFGYVTLCQQEHWPQRLMDRSRTNNGFLGLLSSCKWNMRTGNDWEQKDQEKMLMKLKYHRCNHLWRAVTRKTPCLP